MSDDVTEMRAVPPLPEGPPLLDAAAPSPASPVPASPPPADGPAGRSRRWVLPLAAGVAGLVVGAGGVGAVWGMSGAGTPPAPAAFTLRGAMTLADSLPLDSDYTNCSGSGGYDDIVEGAAVTVYDGDGKVVGTGALDAGTYATSDSTAPCVFHFAVTGVPGGAKFYQVEISHRGRLTVSSAVARAGGFASSLG